MFRFLVLSACLVGVVLGLTMTAIQSAGVTPILLAAEQYEVSDDAHASSGSQDGHEHGGQASHHHDEEAWAPDDGAERLFYTAVSNILAGIGFSAILLVLVNQLHERGRLSLTVGRGLLVGGLCYLVIFVAPSLGLPPEIPGTSAAALESRQLWWLAAVFMAAAGLGILILARGWKRGLGLPLLVMPYIWVPTNEGPLFAHPDPQSVAELTVLHHEFIWASGLTNLAFWLLAGVLCVIALKRLTGTMGGHDDLQ
ncbi:CbtA family protein [Aidingimonas lacisalsi]|uniref:CbtA family protein n=1 Tax=Aidingimonas lacisalsi TaxID=2604086 RepID=UPI0011D232BB|nr:CbtA family protein [Aidingimonas lacisalsi]